MNTDGREPLHLFVVPCGRDKAVLPMPARQLYVGAMFGYVLSTVEIEARLTAEEGTPARVMILSARHGLLDLTTVVVPYEQRMDDEGSITPDALAEQLGVVAAERATEVYAFLPRAYYDRLRDAAARLGARTGDSLPVHDVYEAAPGIGYQRQVIASIRRTQQLGHRCRPNDEGASGLPVLTWNGDSQ